MALEKQKDSVMTSKDGAVKETLIRTKRNVKYVFDTRASDAADLQIPYAVVVDGEVQAKYRDKPEKLGKRREIDIPVDPGSTVGLYLNSDVHPDHRKNLVYVVKAGENDVQVNIVEKLGKDGDASAEVGRAETKAAKSGGKMVDVYTAELNGNVWMRISHVYTPEQADALIPSDTAPVIREAIHRIYSGQTGANIVVKFPVSDGQESDKLTVQFLDEMKGNIGKNTRSYKFLEDVIIRTHPKAFAALLTEARAAGVSVIHVNSAWRPCLGSIAHRAGLGLDIKYLENVTGKVVINRAWLTHANAAPNSNVSPLERELFADYQKSHNEFVKDDNRLAELRQSLKSHDDSVRKAQLQTEATAAAEATSKSEQRFREAQKKWDKERDLHEPKLIQSLRSNLERNPIVSQLLDPWYVDLNTHDKIPKTRNEQKRGTLDDLHSNHLHISIDEGGICP